MRESSKTIAFPGRDTKIMYVADREGGTVSVFDLDREKLLDTDPGDDFKHTPLVAGGEITGLAIDDRSDLPSIYVADRRDRVVVGFSLDAALDEPHEYLSHTPIDLGGALRGRTSKPIFVDRDLASSPFITELTYDATDLVSEFWSLTYRGVRGYEVFGSVQGLQSRSAKEGKTYQDDSGQLSLKVVSGNETRGKDQFYFGVSGAKPLQLTGAPEDMLVRENDLIIVTSDPAEVVVFDLDTQTVTSTTALSDGGPDAMPGASALEDGHLYIPNAANDTLFDMDTDTLAVTVLSPGVSTTSVTVLPDGETLLLSYRSEKKVGFFSLADHSLQALKMSDVPTSACTYTLDDHAYALVPTLSAFADVVDLETRKRVDRSDRSGAESFEDNLEFYDAGQVSSPEMISIATRDGRTQSERWQLEYEGVVPGTQGFSVTVVGDLATLGAGSWNDAKVIAGDQLILDDNEAMEILEIQSDSVLRLVDSPTHQGISSALVRALEGYTVLGSESGFQERRIKENITYESDHSEIKLKIRSSVVNPTTRGDFFTFTTFDGINPVAMSSGGIYSHARCIVPPGDTNPKGFVSRQSLGSVSVINLSNLRESKSVR